MKLLSLRQYSGLAGQGVVPDWLSFLLHFSFYFIFLFPFPFAPFLETKKKKGKGKVPAAFLPTLLSFSCWLDIRLPSTLVCSAQSRTQESVWPQKSL